MFGCFAFVASLISLFLPETLNKNLTDTIDEDGRLNETSISNNLNAVCMEDLETIENEETPAEHWALEKLQQLYLTSHINFSMTCTAIALFSWTLIICVVSIQTCIELYVYTSFSYRSQFYSFFTLYANHEKKSLVNKLLRNQHYKHFLLNVII